MNASAGEPAGQAPTFNADRGCWQTMLPSEYQAAPALVEIILPVPLDPQKKYPVLYILPVEGGTQFGDGLVEAKKADIANKYGVICIYPHFTKVPWFGNHATDPAIRQDDYIVQALVPFIDRTYPTQHDKEGRWLVGFSKSGWGAYTLLFRHMDIFGYAAAWDAPLMMNGDNTGKEWGPLGISSVFGTKEAFLKFLPTKLAEENAAALKERCRLMLGGSAGWKPHVEGMHALLTQLGIPHIYRPDLNGLHRWDSGWFSPTVEELAKIARAPKP